MILQAPYADVQIYVVSYQKKPFLADASRDDPLVAKTRLREAVSYFVYCLRIRVPGANRESLLNLFFRNVEYHNAGRVEAQ